mgnify:FL=1
MKSNDNIKERIQKLSELKSGFFSLKEDEPQKINIKSNELFENETRNNMVKWLVFLCDTLNFNIQTLYRSVIIFDKYISVSNLLEDEELTQEKMNLITIGCLSLGTKLEEINCNYVKFFTDKVLNLPDCQIFSIKDLTQMEMLILKKLNFRTLYNTCYDFLQFFLDIFKYLYNPTDFFLENIKSYSLFLMKQNINTNLFLSMTQSDYAFCCLNQAFNQLGQFNVMTNLKSVLFLLNKNNENNDNLQRKKRIEINNYDNNEINFSRNLEVNLFSLSSF